MTLSAGESFKAGQVRDLDGRQVVSLGVADTLENGNSLAAPVASAGLAAIIAPTPGVYQIRAIIVLTGTAETALQNVRLRQNGIVVGNSLPTLSGQVIVVDFPRVTVTGGNIDLQVIAGAVAGSIYNTVITATRIA